MSKVHQSLVQAGVAEQALMGILCLAQELERLDISYRLTGNFITKTLTENTETQI